MRGGPTTPFPASHPTRRSRLKPGSPPSPSRGGMKTKVDRLAPNEGVRTRCRDASQRPGFADLPLGARGWRAERRKSIWLASEDALAPLGAPHTHPQRSVSARQLRSSSSGKRMLICGDLAIVRAPLSPRTAKLRSSASSWRGTHSGPGGSTDAARVPGLRTRSSPASRRLAIGAPP